MKERKRGKGLGRGWERELEQYGQRLAMGGGVYESLEGLEALAGLRALLAAGERMDGALSALGCLEGEAERGYVQMGERTGALGAALREVVRRREEARTRRRERVGQMVYPAILVVVSVGVLVLMGGYVVPELKVLYAGMARGKALPYWTEHVGQVYLWVGLGIAVLGAWVWAVKAVLDWGSRRWAAVAGWYWRVRHGIPVLGVGLRGRVEERFSEQLGGYLRCGVALGEALGWMAAATADMEERRRIEWLGREVMDGARLSEAVVRVGLLCKDSARLLVLGEESGQLAERLLQSALEMGARRRWQMQQLGKLAEPCLMLGLALMVGGILAAFLLPLVRLYEGLG